MTLRLISSFGEVTFWNASTCHSIRWPVSHAIVAGLRSYSIVPHWRRSRGYPFLQLIGNVRKSLPQKGSSLRDYNGMCLLCPCRPKPSDSRFVFSDDWREKIYKLQTTIKQKRKNRKSSILIETHFSARTIRIGPRRTWIRGGIRRNSRLGNISSGRRHHPLAR
jgi:hypothetical protein